MLPHMPNDAPPIPGEVKTAALFVRIPVDQARELDRIAFETRRAKQAVVSDLLARYLPAQPGTDRRRVTVETDDGPGLVVGHHAFRPYDPDVLTLEDTATLLGVEPKLVEKLAASGELPGRRIGDAWRFARSAVLDWLARGGGAVTRRARTDR